MAATREVGTLWIGGPLSWMEQLCLKSFGDKGQKITLFSYEDIPNVPEGVIRRSGREIIDTDDFIKYEQKNSYALFADLFRLHMIHQCPGMIWVDTDVYCLRPMTYDSEYVMGYELPGEHRVNNAILGLPADSEILRQMLDFTQDRYSVASFLPKSNKETMRAAAKKGKPVHISEQKWGVWGPLMVTHYVHKLGLADRVLPVNAFYPVTFPNRTKFLHRADVAAGLITEETTALHLWASNKHPIGNSHNGLPPKGSYFEKLVQEAAINAALAPIKGRGNTVFDGGLIHALHLASVETAADLTGRARGFLLALHHKFDCDLKLVNVNNSGELQKEDEAWIAETLDFLTANGVAPSRIEVVRDQGKLKPVDVLCNLKGFGDQYKVKFLAPLLESMLHSDTRMFMDIRAGSGAFPFLKTFGTNEPIAETTDDGKKLTRIQVFPRPPDPTNAESSWGRIATELAGTEGWYRPGDNGHSLLYVPRSKDVLVVTFDNLDIAMNKRDDRRPWGYSFIKEQGWSMLSALAGGWTWYRETWIHTQFDALNDSGFFEQYKRVVFYGASMGGYAACAFSPAAPGCDVVAISPQSTVDRSVVPWESRYKAVWDRDFTGKYGDAADVSRAARRVTILFDPYESLDAAHAARFTNENVQRLRAPLLGHRLGSSLNQMGILSPIILGAINGTLSETEYYMLLRARRESPRYRRELFMKAVAKGHKNLANRIGARVLAT